MQQYQRQICGVTLPLEAWQIMYVHRSGGTWKDDLHKEVTLMGSWGVHCLAVPKAFFLYDRVVRRMRMRLGGTTPAGMTFFLYKEYMQLLLVLSRFSCSIKRQSIQHCQGTLILSR